MDHIKINGKEYPFRYGLLAQRELFKNQEAVEDDISLIYLGLKYGASAEGKKLDLTEDQLLGIFDGDLDLFAEAFKLLQSHLGKLKAARGES